MGELFETGGYMMWPITAAGILVLVLAGRAGYKLLRPSHHSLPAVQSSIDGVLFWGAFAALLGVLGTVVGLIQMTQAIHLAGGVEPVMAWTGFGVSLVTTMTGLVVLTVALLVAFALWVPFRRRVEREAAA